MRASRSHAPTVRVPHSRPWLGRQEEAALLRVLRSGHLAQGREVLALERELPSIVGHRHGVAVSSGTAALYLTLRAMGLGRGDDVVIPSYVCVALLNAVNATGATAAICDVDPFTAVVTRDTVRRAITRRTRAVVVPHLFGYPAHSRDIASLGVPLIEDCAQCVGAARNGRPVGGDGIATVFSFYATKLIAAGEGGLVATSDRRLAERVRGAREYDNRDAYAPGFNYKLSDIHAAVARVQVRKLAGNLRRRRALARSYVAAVRRMNGSLMPLDVEPGVCPAYFRFVVRADGRLDRILRTVRLRGIAVARPVYKPLHRYLGLPGFAGADELHKRALSLPIYPGLPVPHRERVLSLLAALA